jgi:hypothetical protein
MGQGRWSGPARHSAKRRQVREPLALGWGVRDASTRGATVVAAFDRDRLGDGLARLHLEGFGPSARVLDGTRGDLVGQLERTGLPAEIAARLVPAAEQRRTALLVVHAPARSEAVADLLGRSGALAVEVVPPDRPANLVDGPLLEVASESPLVDVGP